MQTFRWGAAVVTLLGALWVANTALFIMRAEKAEAVVAGWDVTVNKGRSKTTGMSEHHNTWHAIVQLRDEFGAVHRARSPRALNQRRWEPGTRVPVYYDAEDPTVIFIRDAFDIWLPPVSITTVGVLGLVGTTLLLRFLWRQEGRKAEEVAAIVAKHITKKK